MRKTLVSIFLAVFLCLSLTGCNSQESAYKKGTASFESGDYQTAIEYFTQAGDYEDSKDKLSECEHLLAVANDKTPPKISGVEESLDVTCGTDFNLNDYLKENLTITDDVTTGEFDYKITCDKKAYERTTGKLLTNNSGEFPVEITAKDEAENEGKLSFTLKLNPIHVTKDNLNPVVYDGEYAKITLKSSQHGYVYGTSEYQFVFQVENRIDEMINVYFGTSYTTINGYQISAYFTDIAIGAGNIGEAVIHIYDEDIPEDVGTIEQIITKLCIAKDSEDKSFFQIPMIIDTNIF